MKFKIHCHELEKLTQSTNAMVTISLVGNVILLEKNEMDITLELKRKMKKSGLNVKNGRTCESKITNGSLVKGVPAYFYFLLYSFEGIVKDIEINEIDDLLTLSENFSVSTMKK